MQLPSSSTKFVNMTCGALESFEEEYGVKFAKVTKIALEGDGPVSRKVEQCVCSIPLAIDRISSFSTTPRVYQHLLSSEEWVDDIHSADVIFVSAHSQGSIVSTHLVDLLIRDGHIITSSTENVGKQVHKVTTDASDGSWVSDSNTQGRQRICCLNLCGIHLGPLRYMKSNSFIQPYIQVGTTQPNAPALMVDFFDLVFRKRRCTGDIRVSGVSPVSWLFSTSPSRVLRLFVILTI